ncbi:hypothetical protein EfmAA610_32360 (plasmid) [Enterococcus faecium]|nr:hypothetical protein EfmAA610_32360 [Enterococcus faecium]
MLKDVWNGNSFFDKFYKVQNFSLIIIEALGGKENIESVEACATRLRVAVTTLSLAHFSSLKEIRCPISGYAKLCLLNLGNRNRSIYILLSIEYEP